MRSLVLEQEKGEEGAAGTAPPLQRDDVPAASWLARVPFARLKALAAGAPAAGRRRRPVQVVPLGDGDPLLAPAKRPLYVSSSGVRLHLDGGSLVVEDARARQEEDGAASGDGGGEPARLRFPLEGLSHLTFIGHSRATMPLLLALARDGVPSFFCHRSGELYAQLGPHRAEWGLWLEQAQAAADGDLRLRFAREVVAAKLHNQARLAVRFGWRRRDEVAAELRELEASAANQGSVESLLGLEGRGSAVFFEALAENLPPEWGFTGRQRQPPPDPINSMLSFGYTLLYNHVATALTTVGLDPRIGLIHVGRGRHHALASDLVEEMRWLAEALAWSLVGQRRVKPENFTASPDGRYPCWMTHELRGRFLGYFEDRLHTGFTPPRAPTDGGATGGGATGDGGGAGGEGAAEREGGAAKPTTYRAFLADQARQVARLVRREIGSYRPLRLEA